jgi:hypothetical protein
MAKKSKKTPISIRLSDDELALLEQAKALCDGNQTLALVRGLQALLGGSNKRKTKDQLFAELEAQVAELRRRLG